MQFYIFAYVFLNNIIIKFLIKQKNILCFTF